MNQSMNVYQPDIRKTLVVFGCHADDAESMAGGLIARHTRAGGKAIIIHQLGKPQPPAPDSRAHRAAQILGAEVAFFKTDVFDVTEEGVNALHEALEPFRPALFVALWPLDMHPHHSAAGFLWYRACLDVIGGGDSKLRDGNQLWFGELNPGVNCRSFKPDVWIDIADVADAKWRAMGVYTKDWDGSAEGGIKGWGWFGENQVTVEKFRGYECGCPRAEAFLAYGGWDESPLDRPWGTPMFPGRKPEKNWWEGKATFSKVHGEYKLYCLPVKNGPATNQQPPAELYLETGEQGHGVGIIGCGARGRLNFGRELARAARSTGLRIAALCDRNPERMKEAREQIGALCHQQEIPFAPVLHARAQDLIADDRVDLIIITSPTYLHREHAVAALRSGKKVYCDKPLAHTAEDAVAIVEEEQSTRNPMILGFTRRYEHAWRKAYSLLREGVIGDLIMLQIRDVIPFWPFFQKWHRRREWSGDALNDKASHLCDVFNWFVGDRAVKVNGFGGQRVFHPDPQAPARCSECNRDCPYRCAKEAATPEHLVIFGPSWQAETEIQHRIDTCVFQPGADIYDHASIHFAYRNGVIAALFYCIATPGSPDQETLELVGTRGRLILYRHRGILDVVSDYGKKHEEIDCRPAEFETGGHFGADSELVRELRRFCAGSPPLVTSREGLEATRMISAALRSLDNGGETVRMEEVPDVSL